MVTAYVPRISEQEEDDKKRIKIRNIFISSLLACFFTVLNINFMSNVIQLFICKDIS